MAVCRSELGVSVHKTSFFNPPVHEMVFPLEVVGRIAVPCCEVCLSDVPSALITSVTSRSPDFASLIFPVQVPPKPGAAGAEGAVPVVATGGGAVVGVAVGARPGVGVGDSCNSDIGAGRRCAVIKSSVIATNSNRAADFAFTSNQLPERRKIAVFSTSPVLVVAKAVRSSALGVSVHSTLFKSPPRHKSVRPLTVVK